ncbi:hypothetical protein L484_009622 [Morus notabilis]|uniref:Uncharacterized protein n=1 Tax=Morus notabilis TaxID=981085 RepID=W9RTR4_9ROSA|nr:hypothetical protein L484_009622 [Morus notabilis]
MGSYLGRFWKAAEKAGPEKGTRRMRAGREKRKFLAMWSAKVKGKELVVWRYSVKTFWASLITRGLYLARKLGRIGNLAMVLVVMVVVEK